MMLRTLAADTLITLALCLELFNKQLINKEGK